MLLQKFLRRPKKPKFLFARYVVGTSMQPALQPGKILIARGGHHHIRPGDVVIMYHQGMEKVKRLLKVDGSRIYVVGDNPEGSTDSRTYGWLEREAVLGKVIWPKLAPAAVPADDESIPNISPTSS